MNQPIKKQVIKWKKPIITVPVSATQKKRSGMEYAHNLVQPTGFGNPMPQMPRRNERLKLVETIYGEQHTSKKHSTAQTIPLLPESISTVRDEISIQEQVTENQVERPFTDEELEILACEFFASDHGEEEERESSRPTAFPTAFPIAFSDSDDEDIMSANESIDLQGAVSGSFLDISNAPISSTLIPVHDGFEEPLTEEEYYAMQMRLAFFSPNEKIPNELFPNGLPEAIPKPDIFDKMERIFHGANTHGQRYDLVAPIVQQGIELLSDAEILPETIGKEIEIGFVVKQQDTLLHHQMKVSQKEIDSRNIAQVLAKKCEREMAARMSSALDAKAKGMIVDLAATTAVNIVCAFLPPNFIVQAAKTLLPLIVDKIADVFINKVELNELMQSFFKANEVSELLERHTKEWIAGLHGVINHLEGIYQTHLKIPIGDNPAVLSDLGRLTRIPLNSDSTRNDIITDMKKQREEKLKQSIRTGSSLYNDPYFENLRMAKGQAILKIECELSFARKQLTVAERFQRMSIKEHVNQLCIAGGLGTDIEDFSQRLLCQSIRDAIMHLKDEIRSEQPGMYTDLFKGLGYREEDLPRISIYNAIDIFEH